MANPSSIAPIRLTRKLFLRLVQALLILFLVSEALAWFSSLPAYFEAITNLNVPEISSTSSEVTLSNSVIQARAAALNLDLAAYAAISIASALVVFGLNWLIGGLILWRKPDSWFGLLTATILMVASTSAMSEAIKVAGSVSISGPGALIWPLFFLQLYLFPDGRVIPRWTRWVAYPIFTYLFVVFASDVLINRLELPAFLSQTLIFMTNSTAILVVLLPLILGAQTYRYLRVSGPVEKAQTKWFLLGLILLFLWMALYLFFPKFLTLSNAIGRVELLILPMAVGVAILRYRLWDIDVIIRRTTSYAVITGILALIYFGSIVMLQRLLSPVTGESTPAVVFSTLLIYALFQPIRRRVQDVIDRRFNRTRYDAVNTIEAFAATVRNETDLDALTAELLRVIQQTMQPETLSIILFDRAAEARHRETVGWSKEKQFIEELISQGPIEGGRTWKREDLYDR